jgi:hypothetical protein
MPFRHRGGEGCSFYSFLNSVLDGGEWSASRSGRALPRERTPDTRWIEGWVCFRAGLNTETRRKIINLCRGSNPSHPVRSHIRNELPHLQFYVKKSIQTTGG